MRVVILSADGVALSRSVYTELARRVAERRPTNTEECIKALEGAMEEFHSEMVLYAKSLPQEDR